MSGHSWKDTDPDLRVGGRFFDNRYFCERCGALSGNLASRPRPGDRVSPRGVVEGLGAPGDTCEERRVRSVLEM